MIERQIEPQIIAEKLRAQGMNVETRFVSTNADAEGFEVACCRCGRTAKLPAQPPEGMVVMCPACAKRSGPAADG